MTIPKPPKDLRDAGLALWGSIAGKYELRPDEVARLSAACSTADVIARLEDAWRESDFRMVSKGSMGQEVIHPLIGEIRTQRASLASLLVGLKLPDDDSGVVTNQNREAAQSSWAPGASRGRGA